MKQYYVLEIQKDANGNYAHLVHAANDVLDDKALAKGESVFYQVMASAAISELPMHSAILIEDNGQPVMTKSYTHVDHVVVGNTEE